MPPLVDQEGGFPFGDKVTFITLELMLFAGTMNFQVLSQVGLLCEAFPTVWTAETNLTY